MKDIKKAISIVLAVFVILLCDYEIIARDMTLEMRAKNYSQQIENHFTRRIGRYYPEGSFIINVQTQKERITPSKLEDEITEEDWEELPGLPYVPSRTETLKEDLEEEGPHYRIRSLLISVLLDEEVFTSSDIDFVTRVINDDASISWGRGDIVDITSIVFPSAPPERVRSANEFWEGLALPALFAHPLVAYIGGFLSFLLFFLLVLLMVKLLRRNDTPIYDVYPEHPSYTNAQIDFQKQKKMALNEQSEAEKKTENAEEEKPLPKKTVSFEDLRNELVNIMIGNPAASVKVIEKMYELQDDDGVKEAASFFKALNPNLLDFLALYLGQDKTGSIRVVLGQLEEYDREDIKERFREFRRLYQKEGAVDGMTGGSGEEEKGIFDFLNQLDPQQIFQLVKDEPIKIIAVAVAQVEAKKANKIIQKFPPDVRLQIPTEIAKIVRIPASAYRGIAQKLSRKAVDQKDINYVTTDGLSKLIDILEDSTPEEEKQILEAISKQDLALARKIKKIYITFEEIYRLPDKTVANVLRGFDRGVVTRALVASEEKVRQKILDNLPPRTKTMVEDELDIAKEETPIEQVYEARNAITRTFRELAKSGKINL